MYSESEVDEMMDFIPIKHWDDNFWWFCRHYCRNYTDCPEFYQCPTMARWDNADLDYDNTNNGDQ